jgi:hypothetical protein
VKCGLSEGRTYSEKENRSEEGIWTYIMEELRKLHDKDLYILYFLCNIDKEIL